MGKLVWLLIPLVNIEVAGAVVDQGLHVLEVALQTHMVLVGEQGRTIARLDVSSHHLHLLCFGGLFRHLFWAKVAGTQSKGHFNFYNLAVESLANSCCLMM